MHHWFNDDRGLFSFIKYVLLYAPNQFPREDYLSAEEQMDLDRAFAELNRGLQFLPAHQKSDVGLMNRLRQLLSDSLQSYRQGDDVRGGQLLNEFDLLAFAKTWKGIEESEKPHSSTSS
jgi:hypothetical protein